tara:strand:- start:21754 stop:22335 length:582 start_codon:yes stop_codon:yes gene_type:complete
MKRNKEKNYVRSRETFEQRMARVSLENHNNSKYKKICFKLVEDLMGVEKEEMLKSRKRQNVLARHLLHYALRTKTTLTLEAIGLLTKRDHATVIHGYHYINDSMYDDYISVLKKCVDEECIPELFKTRDMLETAVSHNRAKSTRVENIYSVIFKNIKLFQYENANILQPNKVPSEVLRKETRADRLEREMRGA